MSLSASHCVHIIIVYVQRAPGLQKCMRSLRFYLYNYLYCYICIYFVFILQMPKPQSKGMV